MKISAIGTDALSCVPSVPHNKFLHYIKCFVFVLVSIISFQT